ncbi:hypothetical protein D3C86_1608520 [compost metagenome]
MPISFAVAGAARKMSSWNRGSTSRVLRSISLSEMEIRIASSEPSSSKCSSISFEPIVRSISRSGRRSFMPIIRRGTVSIVSE